MNLHFNPVTLLHLFIIDCVKIIKFKSLLHLEIVDVFSVIDSTHVLHQQVQSAPSLPRYINTDIPVSLQNPYSYLNTHTRTRARTLQTCNNNFFYKILQSN